MQKKKYIIIISDCNFPNFKLFECQNAEAVAITFEKLV